MSIEQTLFQEIEELKKWLNVEKEHSTYKETFKKRIELINWVLENIAELQTYISAYYDASQVVLESQIKNNKSKCVWCGKDSATSESGHGVTAG